MQSKRNLSKLFLTVSLIISLFLPSFSFSNPVSAQEGNAYCADLDLKTLEGMTECADRQVILNTGGVNVTNLTSALNFLKATDYDNVFPYNSDRTNRAKNRNNISLVYQNTTNMLMYGTYKDIEPNPVKNGRSQFLGYTYFGDPIPNESFPQVTSTDMGERYSRDAIANKPWNNMKINSRSAFQIPSQGAIWNKPNTVAHNLSLEEKYSNAKQVAQQYIDEWLNNMVDPYDSSNDGHGDFAKMPIEYKRTHFMILQPPTPISPGLAVEWHSWDGGNKYWYDSIMIRPTKAKGLDLAFNNLKPNFENKQIIGSILNAGDIAVKGKFPVTLIMSTKVKEGEKSKSIFFYEGERDIDLKPGEKQQIYFNISSSDIFSLVPGETYEIVGVINIPSVQTESDIANNIFAVDYTLEGPDFKAEELILTANSDQSEVDVTFKVLKNTTELAGTGTNLHTRID